jgi:carboxyl-terminal processing protease
LSDLLVSLDDGHVSLTAPDREVFFSNKYRRELIGDELLVSFDKELPGRRI